MSTTRYLSSEVAREHTEPTLAGRAFLVSWELSAAFVVAVAIAAWRMFRRRGRSEWGPILDVAEAPSDARPIASPVLNDDGLGTYSLHLGTPEESRNARERAAL
jgi:hypothetical protein